MAQNFVKTNNFKISNRYNSNIRIEFKVSTEKYLIFSFKNPFFDQYFDYDTQSSLNGNANNEYNIFGTIQFTSLRMLTTNLNNNIIFPFLEETRGSLDSGTDQV